MTVRLQKPQSLILVTTASLVTLAITPGLAYYPINLPKMLVLATGAGLLTIPALLGCIQLFRELTMYIVSTFIFCALLLVSTMTNSTPIAQQFWGVWGRSTGVLTYLSFIVLMFSATCVAFRNDPSVVRQWFERVSYITTSYTLMQVGDLDPIDWSQKLMVATLGNINFMSSFLGLASISMITRIMVDKIALPTRLHYLFFISVNGFLIWISGSIQGIAVFAAGVSVVLLMQVRRSRGLKSALIWFSPLLPTGGLILLGTAGIGPLSTLKQETVLFRIDYWLAGIRMTLDNWTNGIGVDSYGDYYEQYRDMAAVTRTGPQRITNTAHNIFLDVSSGAGIFAGIAFVLIFASTLYVIFKMFRSNTFSTTDLAISGMFIGFTVFCLISINQIGVGIWGFIFIGFLQGSAARINLNTKNPNQRNTHSDSKRVLNIPTEQNWNLKTRIASAILGVFIFLVALIPNVTDARMLNAVKRQDSQAMLEAVSSLAATTFHREKYMTLLLDAGRELEAYEFALSEYERNPRSGITLRVIAYTEQAPKELRIGALERLIERDPNNYELVTYARNLLKQLESR